MKQKKISLTVLLLLCMGITALQAQQSANAAGGDASGSGGTASYSVGQPVYTYASGTGSSNQGVQQPYEFFTTGIDEYQDISLSITVFPNPAQSIVNLSITKLPTENLTYQLYDIQGKLLLSQKISSTLSQVPVQNYAAGSYLLKVSDPEKALKTFTLIKN